MGDNGVSLDSWRIRHAREELDAAYRRAGERESQLLSLLQERAAEYAALLARAEAAERRIVAAREAVKELRAVLDSPDMRAPFSLAYVHGHITSAETLARLVAAWDAIDAALAPDAGQEGGTGG